jgi:hypothetical protein
MPLPRVLTALGVSLLFACTAKVDEPRYAAGDGAVATLRNESGVTVWLGGCSVFGFQKREPTGWVDRGTPVVCFWEGFAQPVGARELRQDHFQAPGEPGIWRLRYATGLGCAADRPLSAQSCQSVGDVLTPTFEVVELCAAATCGPQLGMPNWLCADGSVGGPTDRCLRDLGSGQCGWEIRSCP